MGFSKNWLTNSIPLILNCSRAMRGKSRFFQRWAAKKLRLIDQAVREMSSMVGRAAARAVPAVFRTVRRVMACLHVLAELMRFRMNLGVFLIFQPRQVQRRGALC